MNILLINHYAGSSINGMEYRPYHFASEWIKLGHRVTIIGASFSHIRSINPRCVTSITTENIDDIRYLWLKTPEYHGNGLKRVKNMFSFARQLWMRCLPIEKPDVVIDSSTYPLTIYGSNRIAKKYNARLIFEVHDLWPLTPIELGGFSRWHPFVIVMQWAENYAYKNAHLVVSLLPKAKNHMIHQGMSPEKFVYIPNGVDISSKALSNPLPKEHTEILEKLRQNRKFVIGYTGTHGMANVLEYFIEAAWLLKGQDKVHFVLVGDGPEKKVLQHLVRKRDLTNVTFLSPIPKTSIQTLLSLMDVCYIGIDRCSIFRFGISPNKLFDYMLAAKPVISAIEAGNDIVAETGCGISVQPENPEMISRAIIQLMNMTPEERETMGLKGKEYVMAHHDYKVLAKRFLEFI